MSLRHWELYYRDGLLASVPLGEDRGYTLELRDVWREFFGSLGDCARILDVGTGNGPIPLIAREVATAAGRRFTIHATDLARIDPVRDVADGKRLFEGITFHPEVATERLPFDADSFDAVSGQYAIEYSAMDDALDELRRVLGPGGRAQFVLHHDQSVIARNARETVRLSQLVLEDTLLFRRMQRYFSTRGRAAAAARSAHADLLAAVSVLREAARASGNPMLLARLLENVGQVLGLEGRMGAGAIGVEIDRLESSFRAALRRTKDLLQAARSEAAMLESANLAAVRGFTVAALAPLRHAGRVLVGWRWNLLRD